MRCLSVLAVSCLALPAMAEDLNFTLRNATSSPLTEFYASPPSTNDWEEDILGIDVLDPKERAQITIADMREDCRYDLRAVFDDGEVVEKRKVDLCDTEEFSFTD